MVKLIEEEIEEKGNIVLVGHGNSMRPMLVPEHNIVKIKAVTGHLKKYDVVLFKDNRGRYILHRIIKIYPDSYTLRGDSCIECETGIKKSDILGVAVEFIRDTEKNGRDGHKWVKVTDLSYKLYSRLVVAVYPVRKKFAKRDKK